MMTMTIICRLLSDCDISGWKGRLQCRESNGCLHSKIAYLDLPAVIVEGGSRPLFKMIPVRTLPLSTIFYHVNSLVPTSS